MQWLEIQRRWRPRLARAARLVCLGFGTWVILGAAACATTSRLMTLPPSPATTSACDNRCASLSCPAGTRCVLSAACAPRCEPEQLQRP